jgi:uncharacterized protein YyaL (SSP411 family)
VHHPLQFLLSRAGLAVAVFSLLIGCEGKRMEEETPYGEMKGDILAIPAGNALGGLPGPVYGSQADSPIHWQPWTKASLQKAHDSQRLALAVIAMQQQPSYVDILRGLSSDAAMVELINSSYVPILIDGDAIRELGILGGELCAEIGNDLQLPLMVWMTAEGNPVAWMPLPSKDSGSASELFSQSHTMVARMWADDPDYIRANSRLDRANRQERMLARLKDNETSEEPAADAQHALRQLTSLYDPLSRTFDQAGGLFPVGVLDVLAMSSRMEGLPDDLRDRSLKVLDSLLDDILVSPMFDPLDGGVFSSRRGSSWSFPLYHRDCSSQARVIVSLLNAYEATGDKRSLERAMGVLEFVKENHMTEAGLFTLGSNVAGDVSKWLWLYENVRDILSPEELPVWMAASGMKEGGNLPPELDPRREYFRGNSIAFAKSPDEVANLLHTDPARVNELLGSAQAKLLEARNGRMKVSSSDKEPNPVATFRMISAYATAYRITGQISYRDLASETLMKAKEHFKEGPRLKAYAGDGPESLLAARAFVYGAAIQAALDVEAVTLRGDWLLWAGDLSSTVSEEFSSEAYVKECPLAADLTGLPITDQDMLFDESTLGLLAMSESRLDALGIPLVPALRKKLTSFPIRAVQSPVLHSDLIQAALMQGFSVTYVFGKDTPESLKEALARSPLKGVNRRLVRPSDPPHLIPKPGEAVRLAPDGAASPVRSASDVHVPPLP